MWFRCCCVLLSLVVTAGAKPAEAELATALAVRYAPYVDWQALFDVEVLAELPVERYWRTPEEIRAQRAVGALPLVGLHIALDPGHIGGACGALEGREFRMAEADFFVREGELVLEVARMARDQLQALGAQVTLLREANVPVNPKGPIDYLERAARELPRPKSSSLEDLLVYGQALRGRAVNLSLISGELVERARRVNMEIQPDALISLHINAAVWPVSKVSESESESAGRELESIFQRLSGQASSSVHPGPLVQSNHLHALIFGCVSAQELKSARQQEQFLVKLSNQSGEPEVLLGGALVSALAKAIQLPASTYTGRNAVLLDAEQPYLFARNLMLLRTVECPTVLLEPYVANSVVTYARIQAALGNRAARAELAEDDILVEYADAVVAGVLACYGDVSK